MANFYVSKDAISKTAAVITGEEAQHISRVLRMKRGDCVTLCDGEGMFYDATLSELDDKSVTAYITREYIAPTEPETKITIFQGVPKNPKLETIVQKVTEVGAVGIVPVDTSRSVAKLNKESKIDRLRKIAAEAAKQSKRGIVPKVSDTISFARAIDMVRKYDLVLIAYEKETETTIRTALCGKKPKNVAVLIGPEGGFEEEEVLMAKEKGAVSVTLGKRILRTETAPVALSAIILYELGDMQ